MSDYYTQDPTRLAGTPKATIADYVEQHNLRVPRRFASLADARASGLPFLARSEHPQEYAGASGLLESFKDRELTSISSESELVEKCEEITEESKLSNIAQYCALTNTSEADFRKNISYSFWEFLPGYNQTIIADNTISGRYHVMTNMRGSWNYTIRENGTTKSDLIHPLRQELKDTLPNLIELYETIRHLPHFNPTHCPIMEMQTVGNIPYFLQYHRTRDMNPSTFVLDRKHSVHESQALFVRGATPPEGLTVDATLVYAFLERFPHEQDQHGFSNFKLPQQDQASFDKHYYKLFAELMLPKRKVQINHNSLDGACADAVTGHDTRSNLFKPEVSLVCWPPLFTGEEKRRLYNRALKTNQDQKIKVHVISDGTTAYVRRV